MVIRKARLAGGQDNWLARKRFSVLAGEWTSAGGNGIGELLGKGWSAPEKWGIWGVGESHELRLFLPSVPSADILLEANVNAALVGSRVSQEVDVLVGGRRLTTWRFCKNWTAVSGRFGFRRMLSGGQQWHRSGVSLPLL